MRISAEPTDKKAFRRYCKILSEGKTPHVYLDGVEQKHVVAVNAKRGWVLACRLSALGHVYAVGDHIATRVKRGRVKVLTSTKKPGHV